MEPDTNDDGADWSGQWLIELTAYEQEQDDLAVLNGEAE